jgi:hypothetical protein
MTVHTILVMFLNKFKLKKNTFLVAFYILVYIYTLDDICYCRSLAFNSSVGLFVHWTDICM